MPYIYVVDASNGAVIVAASVQIDFYFPITGQTDPNGAFYFDPLPYNAYNTIVWANGYNAFTTTIDGVSDVTIALSAVTPPSTATTIIAIRVRDINKDVWYSWDNGARPWNVSTGIAVGTPVYAVVYATTPIAQNVTMKVMDANTGTVLASKTAWAVPGSGSGQGIFVEWTGNMPASGQLAFTSTSAP